MAQRGHGAPRARSGGRASLDDFVRRFYAGAGGEPALKPYVEGDVYAALASVVPGDWRALIRGHLDSLGPQTLLAGLESAGWQLSYSAAKNSYIETQQKRRKQVRRDWSIGLALDDKGLITDVIGGRAAARAGAAPGMTLVAVDGRKYRVEVLDSALIAAQQRTGRSSCWWRTTSSSALCGWSTSTVRASPT